ncbi:alpha/beta fold hydrolase [Thiospirochaeta perfilievii]|uniref:Alpha/beta fold hydrolase n=1 Tax=Thiospirochaeta perfilievii TaxID=252967 RepID=A0A5C1QES0_9SPIO|nr:alpha/beta hydrolase [Thiospirochaeta perfilievii]QEN05570.1 alpha/beta fold hydrolase [Thiospirochaeta perfilievii]
MNLDYSFFKVDDGHSLAYKKWDRVESPKGVVIIVHGMAEHIERYDELACYLNELGLIVYGTDQRGHGKTSGKKGIFTYNDSFKRVIKDQSEFFYFVEKNHPELKINYLAHSMGSYVTRALLQSYQLPVNRLILSGTGFEPVLKARSASLLAGIICKFKGTGADAVLLDKMVNEPFAAAIKNPTTSFDWLSRDPLEVAKYINDSNCGFICTNKFYKDFFRIVAVACSKRSMKKIDKNLEILLYSGDMDPVGGKNASGVKKVFKLYKDLGLNVQMKINQGGRHESVNETNKVEVFKEFSNFFLK